jgi:hypothetical protein
VEHATDRVVAAAQDRACELRLQRAEHADHRAEHADVGAGRDVSAGDVLEHAAQARRVGEGAWIGRQGPAVPADRARVHDRHARERARVGDEELGGEVVRALDHEVDAFERRTCGRGLEALASCVHLTRTERRQSRRRGVGFGVPDVVVAEEHLPVQVRLVHHVVVEDRDRELASHREHQRARGGAAEATHADEQDAV